MKTKAGIFSKDNNHFTWKDHLKTIVPFCYIGLKWSRMYFTLLTKEIIWIPEAEEPEMFHVQIQMEIIQIHVSIAGVNSFLYSQRVIIQIAAPEETFLYWSKRKLYTVINSWKKSLLYRVCSPESGQQNASQKIIPLFISCVVSVTIFSFQSNNKYCSSYICFSID